MKKPILLLAAFVLAGCSSPLAGGRQQSSTALTSCAGPTTHWEHQLVSEYGEGVTPFLQLVAIGDP